MAGGDASAARRPGAGVVAIGIDHVRLSYHYLDCADLDGYASLFDDDAILYRPHGGHIRGGREVGEFRSRQLRAWGARHALVDVLAVESQVVAIGRLVRDRPGADAGDIELADVFTISPEGLLLTQKTYFFVDLDGWELPGWHG
ncbi:MULTISPECIES: nuclear transport factor 2 family protein [unclassified Micromonospora]|uniref:nuclear transport factor 2 family protein n=1 Tax=unclassified Micromonospora TaxID=2617518 RepID=UPI00362A198B